MRVTLHFHFLIRPSRAECSPVCCGYCIDFDVAFIGNELQTTRRKTDCCIRTANKRLRAQQKGCVAPPSDIKEKARLIKGTSHNEPF